MDPTFFHETYIKIESIENPHPKHTIYIYKVAYKPEFLVRFEHNDKIYNYYFTNSDKSIFIINDLVCDVFINFYKTNSVNMTLPFKIFNPNNYTMELIKTYTILIDFLKEMTNYSCFFTKPITDSAGENA